MNKMTVRDVDFNGKRVLVRVDFNVPIKDGNVTDDTRIRAAVPTLKHILDQNPVYMVLMSHLGRPKGKRNPDMSLAPVAPVLAQLLGQEVLFAEDCVGEKAETAVNGLASGQILLLENTRFHAGEKANDPDFAAQLATYGDVLVNDAFGTAHRAHASNVGAADNLTAVAGLLLEKEIDYLANTIESPQKPFAAILGGAKVSDKINVIETLLGKVDHLLIGGGMANTFFAAKGTQMADSLVEDDALETAKALIDKGGDKLVLPADLIIADAFDNDASKRSIPAGEDIPAGWRALDIGEKTVADFKEILQDAGTIVWNGPMGVFEMPNFAEGTFAVAKLLADRSDKGATTIIGGGDSASAAQKSGLADRITHISTGGGASLEMLEGKTLPGLAALTDRT